MALKIKEGAELYPYGERCKPFTSESELSQEVLEHLQTRYPDEIIDDEAESKKKKQTK